MNFLKGFAVGVLSFLLFLSLAVFGIAFTIQSTVLNPDFIASEINRFDVSSIADEFLEMESSEEFPELEEVIQDTIQNLEPVIEARLDDTIHAIYEYFPGDTENLNLNTVLRENFLTEDLMSGIIESIDISEMFGPLLSQKLAESIPVEIENLDEFVIDAIDKAEPEIKTQLVSVSGPVFDYILGLSNNLNASISLVEVKEVLKNEIYQFVLKEIPPELESIPETMRKEYFDSLYAEISNQLPSEIPLDESIISPDVPAGFEEGLTAAEEGISEAAVYVRYFQTAYMILIVFMALMVIFIILILRDVKITARRLGVPLITYGALEYAGIWAAKYMMRSQTLLPQEIPSQLESWAFQLVESFMRPLEILSLVLLVAGIVLVVVSYVYKRGEEVQA